MKTDKYLEFISANIITSDGKIFDLNRNQYRQYDNGSGYKFIRVNKSQYYIHRLVLIKFRGYKHGLQANHKDCNKSNNCLENLEWVTNKENMIHASVNGRLYTSEYQKIRTSLANRGGGSSRNKKLKPEWIRYIFRLKELGEINKNIGKIFNVNRETIGYILRGKTWKHISHPGHWGRQGND